MPEIDSSLLETGIAIVGIAGRYPGASDIEEFWHNIRNGVESIEHLSEEQLLANGVDPQLLKNPNYVPASGSLPGVDLFDAGYFGFSPKDAAVTDPQHRQFLECAVEAFEHAGHSTQRFDGSIGVFVGCGMNSYFVNNLLKNPEMLRTVGVFLLRHTGNDRDFLPTTVSYKLDLRGPSMAIQTACSTSLVAIHTACQSILSGECDMAIAGGSTIIVPNGQGYLYRDNEPVSPDGHCRPFSDDSAGTVLTSGTGAIVIRRLEDAIEDGDTIHAVIRGTAVNNDGAGKVGYLAPSVEGHASAVAEALSVADISADTIDYVEAHGTGTRVGDPIEISALTQAFRASTDRTGYCRIGSVKSNIGHLDTAAGVASLTKVVQALKAREMPPSLHFRAPNPEIDFDNSPFRVNDQLRPWERGNTPRRAGVSSLGIGGTNAHVILEEAPELPDSDAPTRPYQVLPLSAKSRTALDQAALRLADWCEAAPEAKLADVAFTLQEGRDYWEHRMVVTAAGIDDLVSTLRERPAARVGTGKASSSAENVAFMFSGAGAQYPNMARGLYEREPVFRDAMDRCLREVEPLIDFDLKSLLYPKPGAEDAAREALEVPSRLCPAVAATEWAMAQLWKSWGIEPSATIGHSLGEYVAACLAGVMSLKDMLYLVVLRGRLIDRLSGGAMLSLPMSEEEAREWIGDELDLAAVNSPGLSVASGAMEKVDALRERLAAADIEARLIPVNAAGHSRHLDPILEEFREGVARVELHAPQSPYVSNVTGTWADPDYVRQPQYWVDHLRGTVRFNDGLRTLIASDELVLLEVGPGGTLCTFARQQDSAPPGIVASLRKPADAVNDAEFAAGALGRLWMCGLDVDWSVLRPDERRRRLPLPAYPFEHKSYWVEPAAAEAADAVTQGLLERLPARDQWLRQPHWQYAPAVPLAADGDPENWLLFIDEAGVGDALARRLRETGHTVTSVRIADGFYDSGDGAFNLAPEFGRAGFEQLVAALEEQNRLPTRLVHCWGLTLDQRHRAGSSVLDSNLEAGFYSLLYLFQALSEHADAVERLDVIVNGLAVVSDADGDCRPEKAALMGPVRVIPREITNLSARLVDVHLPTTQPTGLKAWAGLVPAYVEPAELERIAANLYDELFSGASSDAVAWREDKRYEEVLLPALLRKSVDAPAAIREGGTYLITGGLGGLGFALGEAIARRHKARVLLLSRRPFPPEEEWDRWLETHGEGDQTACRIRSIRAVRAEGGDLLPRTVDVTDEDGLRAVREEAEHQFGAIRGILHAAGAVSDGVLQTKSKADAEKVFASKIHGTLTLERVFDDAALDFMVLFSSTSAVVGLPGQIDYAGANAFLNSFAQKRTLSGKPTLALGWGIWNDVGGAVDLAVNVLGQPREASYQRKTLSPLLDTCTQDGPDHWRWEADWNAAELWELNEHRTIEGVPLLPGTGFLELARSAFCDAQGEKPCQIKDVAFLEPLVASDDRPLHVIMTLDRAKGGYQFVVSTENGERTHATMIVQPLSQAPRYLDWAPLAAAETVERNRAANGGRLASAQEAQIGFGPRWSCLREVALGINRAEGTLQLADAYKDDLASSKLHSALMDIATSLAVPTINGWEAGRYVYVPLSYTALRVYDSLPATVNVQLHGRDDNTADREVAVFDLRICSETGRTLVEIDGYTMRRLDGTAEFTQRKHAERGGRTAEPSAIEAVFLESYEQGIRLQEGIETLLDAIAAKADGALVVSPVPIDRWRERIRAACRTSGEGTEITFERPDLDNEYVAPSTAMEAELVKLWQEFLGVGQVGIDDDFFDLGGHSLIAVRLFARLKKQFGVDWPISMLFDAPNIRRFAELLAAEVGEPTSDAEPQGPAPSGGPRFRYLVPMNVPRETDRLPLFLVAGMFGNVLNLRHLAAHLGEDQPVYALQAKGLYGDDEPHENFVDAAKDYLEEVRQIAPEGPYLLGGFSGGGVTAFEMAHQLRAAGETVADIIMLDSIPPHPAWPLPSAMDKLKISLQRFKRDVLRDPVEWLRIRVRWEFEKREARGEGQEREQTPAEFRSELIQAAFLRSLGRYEMRPYEGRIQLFRPPLEKTYDLGGGRIANANRQLMEHQNWWSPWLTEGVNVTVVPGDHDSMVLEPNVGVLAREVRKALDAAHSHYDKEYADTNGIEFPEKVSAG